MWWWWWGGGEEGEEGRGGGVGGVGGGVGGWGGGGEGGGGWGGVGGGGGWVGVGGGGGGAFGGCIIADSILRGYRKSTTPASLALTPPPLMKTNLYDPFSSLTAGFFNELFNRVGAGWTEGYGSRCTHTPPPPITIVLGGKKKEEVKTQAEPFTAGPAPDE